MWRGLACTQQVEPIFLNISKTLETMLAFELAVKYLQGSDEIYLACPVLGIANEAEVIWAFGGLQRL